MDMIDWNADDWKEKFIKASKERNSDVLYELRQEVIWTTKQISQEGFYKSGEITISLERPQASTLYMEEIDVSELDLSDAAGPVKILVINKDCLEVAREYADRKPLVLNMANRQTAGGGVEYGAGAQEECLVRSSNYFQTLYPMQQYYPMDRNYGGVYSPDVTVFRGLERNGYPLLEKPFKVNFVAVAAVNRPSLTPWGTFIPEIRKATENKIRTVLNIAILQKQKFLILSALGCGAFRNPPEEVARIFKEQLAQEPYRSYFETVIFAIKPNHRDTNNYNFKTFNRILGNTEIEASVDDKYNLERFRKTQRAAYLDALEEIRNGHKESHWMWYIFPQIKGLGFTETSRFYAISCLDEAKEYLKDENLRNHLVEISMALLDLPVSDAYTVMGSPDDKKLRSSMTLFAMAEPECDVFQQVLNKFFDGKKDQMTMDILEDLK